MVTSDPFFQNDPFLDFWIFLDAPSHFYKRVCPSFGPSVRPSPVIFRRVLGASCAVHPTLFTLKGVTLSSLSWALASYLIKLMFFTIFSDKPAISDFLTFTGNASTYCSGDRVTYRCTERRQK